jgi:uncharacterized protein (DUF58 family)
VLLCARREARRGVLLCARREVRLGVLLCAWREARLGVLLCARREVRLGVLRGLRREVTATALAAARSERRLGCAAGGDRRPAGRPPRSGEHRADLGLDAAALANGPSRGEIGLVRPAARLVGALVAIPEMLDIGPPSASLRMCHAVVVLFR